MLLAKFCDDSIDRVTWSASETYSQNGYSKLRLPDPLAIDTPGGGYIMADDYKALTKQIERLATRLTRLEGSIEHAPQSGGATKSSDEAQHFCSLPEVPQRVLDPNVSPDRAR